MAHSLKPLRSHIPALRNTLFESWLIVLNASSEYFYAEIAQTHMPWLAEKYSIEA